MGFRAETAFRSGGTHVSKSSTTFRSGGRHVSESASIFPALAKLLRNGSRIAPVHFSQAYTVRKIQLGFLVSFAMLEFQ
jgi:hypothetical protein